MKWLKKFENWTPGKDFGNIISDNTELKDESVISQYIEYNGLPDIILDIWKYMKTEFGKYPTKVTNRGMEYSAPGGKIEVEFKGGDGQVYLWKFRVYIDQKSTLDRPEIKSDLVKSCKFDFSQLKNMMSH
jgi:hypothetical protein